MPVFPKNQVTITSLEKQAIKKVCYFINTFLNCNIPPVKKKEKKTALRTISNALLMHIRNSLYALVIVPYFKQTCVPFIAPGFSSAVKLCLKQVLSKRSHCIVAQIIITAAPRYMLLLPIEWSSLKKPSAKILQTESDEKISRLDNVAQTKFKVPKYKA